MDLDEVATVVAAVAATGAVQGLSEDAARSAVARLRERLRQAFRCDEGATAALERTNPETGGRETLPLSVVIAQRMQQDAQFATEMVRWVDSNLARNNAAAQQFIHAARDAYVAGNDLTIHRGRGA